MLSNILNEIICTTFEKIVGKNQISKEGPNRALQVSFKLSLDYDNEDGYRWLDIIIYAPMNYAYVVTKERWNRYSLDAVKEYTDEGEVVFKDGMGYEEGESGLTFVSCHDSCWRDGVNRIINDNRDRLLTLSGWKDWYSIIEVDDELEKAIRESREKAHERR